MSKTNKLNFEKALKYLNSLIEKMEDDELDLEESLKHYEKGVNLIRQCQTALQKAEQKVQIITEKNGKIEETPFTEDNHS